MNESGGTNKVCLEVCLGMYLCLRMCLGMSADEITGLFWLWRVCLRLRNSLLETCETHTPVIDVDEKRIRQGAHKVVEFLCQAHWA